MRHAGNLITHTALDAKQIAVREIAVVTILKLLLDVPQPETRYLRM